jgi:hypothetical protein
MGVSTVLLDTHALVWALSAPERLGDTARTLIESPFTEVLVSAASAWELATKTRLRKFREAEPIVASRSSSTSRSSRLSVLPTFLSGRNMRSERADSGGTIATRLIACWLPKRFSNTQRC